MRLSTPRISLFALLVLAFACRGTGSDLTELDRAQVRAQQKRGFDVAHYQLDIEVFPERREIDGTCRIRFVAVVDDLERVEFDLEELRVIAVSDLRGAPLEFRQADGSVAATLATPLRKGEMGEVAITYSGAPRKGLWFAGRGEVPTHVWTQGECEDSRWWFPCIDVPSERATHELTVTMPDDWISVAGGARLDSTTHAGRRTDRWRTTDPHPAYLTTLAAGQFIQLDGEWEGIPLSWLSEPQFEAWIEESLGDTDDALAFMTELTGVPFPYEKYAQVCVENFPFGGMENISATTLTATCLQDHRGNIDNPATGLVVHEAVHQWFGDLMTCKEWSQIWLNEGFATYFTNVFFERTVGVDDFRVRMRDAQDQYTAADQGSERRPIVHDVYKDPIDLFFGGHTYQGGATRLHLLRSVLGDDVFFEGVEHYAENNRNQSVETDDLLASFEAVSQRELDWFFEQWLESPGFPEFEVSWRYDPEAGQVLVTIDQTQEIGDGTLAAYRTPVHIEVRTETGPRQATFDLRRRREIVKIPVSSQPQWVRFDKYGWIPKKLRSRKTLDEWLLIAAEDDDVNGRRDAIHALATGGTGAEREDKIRAIEAIAARAENDSSPAVRSDALRALGDFPSEPARKLLMKAAAEDSSAKCRAAALRTLGKLGESELLADFARTQFDAGYTWATMSAAAELYRNSAPRKAKEQLLRWAETDSPHSVLRANLIGQLGELDEKGIVYDLARIALDGDEHQSVRVEAVRGMGKTGKGSNEVTRILLSLLEGRFARLRLAALESLKELDDSAALQQLAAYYETCVVPRERRLIEKMLRGRG